MVGSAFETIVLDSIATNIASRRPLRASSTSRCVIWPEDSASEGADEGAEPGTAGEDKAATFARQDWLQVSTICLLVVRCNQSEGGHIRPVRRGRGQSGCWPSARVRFATVSSLGEAASLLVCSSWTSSSARCTATERGAVDADAHDVAAHLEDRDGDVLADDDALTRTAAQDQHAVTLPGRRRARQLTRSAG